MTAGRQWVITCMRQQEIIVGGVERKILRHGPIKRRLYQCGITSIKTMGRGNRR